MRLAIVALALSAGCSMTWGNRATVGVATVAGAAMALDWCMTRDAAANWRGRWEGGAAAMVIGREPPPEHVDAYFAFTAGAVAVLVAVVPERYRWAPLAALTGVEAVIVRRNLRSTRCGPIGHGWP